MTSKSDNKDFTKEFDALAKNTKDNLEAFRHRVLDLSKNELKRVIIALTEMPIETTVTLRNKKEVEIFGLGAKIKQDIISMTIEYLKNEGKQENSKGDKFSLTNLEVNNG
tara:strand:+ start:535 stop:864 length:330 start_codon:yes stop_codon:yes gene_type:complete